MSGKLVLVTSPTGFLGAHVFRELLEKGYRVRGTARSKEKADELKKDFSKYAAQIESFVDVQDIASDNCFDEAVKGVDYVIHVASPFFTDIKNNEKDMLIPAIKGTKNVLSACGKEKSIKRLILTSSFAAILDFDKGTRPGYTYTEKDWNPTTYEEAAKSDKGGYVYCASKKLAEKEAWDYVEKNKPSWDMATMCMPMIFGPVVHPVKSMDKLNTSTAQIWSVINGEAKEVPATDFPAWVDVRDAATAHVEALENPQASNQRFLVAAGYFDNNDIARIAKKRYPERNIPEPKSNEKIDAYTVDGSKAEKILLGRKYITLKKCITDTADQLFKLEKELS
ncbi:hypothetical protein BZG36_01310 [Bifiguratus adelaidae]|uniref:3-beta hydroxysteroid dehydrogenase/isomerase domain-containing protein n=1 Tax=Bifiguratus adelaidae TaxID=1938954 RepID=A0A261Y540_9FUNG|nr:hypothetical protein BZG36_01310 [Bifiguratus adelaidae]